MNIKITLLRRVSLFALIIICSWQMSFGQAYVDSLYAVQISDTNLIYGTAVDYKGCTTDLRLDIYKPIGSPDTDRPLLILVHGGSFISGSKDAIQVVNMAKDFAAKGYVVATVNYRLGQHLRSYVATPTVPPLFTDPTLVCHYFAENEVERAAFRGMQDVKDAIRYMKNRAATDSVSKAKVFVGGESAGGIISSMVGFLDDISEKPDSCFSVSTAAAPASNLNCTLNPCATNSRLRPDLGDIDGNPSAFPNENAEVAGVFSMFGGMFSNLFTISHNPPQKYYVYHQTCDPVVAVDSGRVYRWLDNCLYNCSAYTPYQAGIGPELKGANAIVGYENMAAHGGSFHANIVQNGPPPNAWPNCTNCVIGAFTPQYAPCHTVVNPKVEARSIAQFFLSCITVGVDNGITVNMTVSPNPAHDRVKIEFEQASGFYEVSLFDQLGRALKVPQSISDAKKMELDLSGLEKGTYFLRATSEGGSTHRVLILE